MKKQNYFKTIFLLLLFSINLSAQVPPYVPTNGLVGWWPFTGNANDLSGNGNNGTNNGATLTTDRFSNANNAYFVNGINNWIQTNTSFLQTNNPHSISIWWRTSDSTQMDQTIFNTNPHTLENIVLNAFPNTNYKLAYYLGSGLGSWNIISTPNNFITIPANLVQWHQTVFVKDASLSWKFYHDGVLTHTFSSATNTGSQMASLRFGSWTVGFSGGCFKGKLDDIGVWNRALNQAEVTALYNAVSCVAPIASITTQGNSTFCTGGSCTLNANAGNSYTYQWYNNGTLINGATAITFTASQAGNYTVKVTDGLTSCFTTSQPQSVIVNPQPNVSFGFLASFVCIRTAPINLLGSPNGGTYQGPGISGSAFSPTVAGLGNKNLKYTYTDNNGCSNFANQSVIIYDTIICPTVSGIIKNSEDLLNEESVKIYPNPNQGFFNLELTECKNSIIKITDVLGKTILNQKAELFNEIDLKNQSSGVYTINIITDKKIKYSTKVIKE